MRFICECGSEWDVDSTQVYYCSKCDTHYFLVAAPFEVFNHYEQFLLRKKDKSMEKICSELALKRLVCYWQPQLIGQLSIPSITRSSISESGCYDIHTISPCLSEYQKTEYALFWLAPFHPLTPFSIPSLANLIYRIGNYLWKEFEPLIVSILPESNWARLSKKIHEQMGAIPQMGPHFPDLLKEYLHSILITGINLKTYKTLFIHDRVRPFEPLSVAEFQRVHQRADYRTIVKVEYEKWDMEVVQQKLRERLHEPINVKFGEAGYQHWTK